MDPVTVTFLALGIAFHVVPAIKFLLGNPDVVANLVLILRKCKTVLEEELDELVDSGMKVENSKANVERYYADKSDSINETITQLNTILKEVSDLTSQVSQYKTDVADIYYNAQALEESLSNIREGASEDFSKVLSSGRLPVNKIAELRNVAALIKKSELASIGKQERPTESLVEEISDKSEQLRKKSAEKRQLVEVLLKENRYITVANKMFGFDITHKFESKTTYRFSRAALGEIGLDDVNAAPMLPLDDNHMTSQNPASARRKFTKVLFILGPMVVAAIATVGAIVQIMGNGQGLCDRYPSAGICLNESVD